MLCLPPDGKRLLPPMETLNTSIQAWLFIAVECINMKQVIYEILLYTQYLS